MSFIRLSTACLLVACVLAPLPVEAEQGIGEKIGEQVDRALGQLSEELREGFAKAREGVDRMSVVGRVYARIHWDKALTNASVAIDVDKTRTATLRGTVPNLAAKEKAGQLAGDTVGVERVVNDLKVVQDSGR